MSNTRHATEDSEFSQERFASSAEFEQGLLANLVARRCAENIETAADRDLLFFLQYLSHQPGGLRKAVREILAAFPDRIGTPAMQRAGMKPGQVYSAEQVRQVRAQIPSGEFDYLLHGESDELNTEPALAPSQRPKSYPAKTFVDRCQSAAAGLEKLLGRLCLDPQLEMEKAAPWYFPALVQTLRDYQTEYCRRGMAGFAETEITRQVFEMLDYSMEEKCLVLFEGSPRTGKSFAARTWCQLHPGRARYVQVPATSDDISFYRVMAEALGVSSALSMKGVQMRERVEKVLQTSGLMLVMDEAHYLWPQNNRREALPNRVNWLMTALINYGVPVALVSTPQFTRDQKVIEKKTGWASGQFIGRIGQYRELPARLSEDELAAVARCHLPGAEEKSIRALVSIAKLSEGYISGIEHAVKRARHEAKKQGRSEVTFADVRKAIEGHVLPSDSALKEAMETATAPGRSRPAARPAPQASLSADRSAAPENVSRPRFETNALTPAQHD